METVVLDIQGMTCAGCVKSVENVLCAVDGVRKVWVSLETAKATIEYDAERTGIGALKSAIGDAGYEITP